jgi:hypothetical protein
VLRAAIIIESHQGKSSFFALKTLIVSDSRKPKKLDVLWLVTRLVPIETASIGTQKFSELDLCH